MMFIIKLALFIASYYLTVNSSIGLGGAWIVGGLTMIVFDILSNIETEWD